MTQPIISVEKLGKKYRLGQNTGSNSDGLRHLISNGLSKMVGRSKETREESISTVDEFWALKNVNFELAQGERLGIIGRNGAGKSTLLKILSRITDPTEGRVTLRGRVASLLEVGTGFHPELTGRENIFLNGAILGMTRAEIKKKFDAIVSFAEVESFLDTPVKRYSSGMYVRLAFAVAAHLDPEILIVDEVLAVGDVQFQKKCLGKMDEVSQGGRTVLFVSHNMQAVRRLCSKAVLLEKGMTRSFERVEDAIRAYSSDLSISGYEIELGRRTRHPGLGNQARLLSLGVAPNSLVRYGQPLKLNIRVNCTLEVRDLVVGIAFETQDGDRVLTLDSDQGGKLLDLPRGESVITMELPFNPLHPETYAIITSLFSHGTTLDGLSGVGAWVVDSTIEDVAATRGYGACRMPVKVQVENVSSPVQARLEPVH